MNRNLGMNDLRNILDFYHLKTPNTIHRIKKKANYVIVKHLCDSNCDCQYKYKKLLYVLHKKRIISNQKKIKQSSNQSLILFIICKNYKGDYEKATKRG